MGVLTKIQMQERAKRNRNRLKMRGKLMPKGTPPREYRPVAEPAVHPSRRPMGVFEAAAALDRLNLLLPAWLHLLRKKAKEAEKDAV